MTGWQPVVKSKLNHAICANVTQWDKDTYLDIIYIYKKNKHIIFALSSR